MSRALLYVRFADGSVKYGQFSGDVAGSPLYDTPADAWDYYDEDAEDYSLPRDGEPVDIAANYGNGLAWVGTATRHHLTGGFDPYERGASPVRGLPDWARYPAVKQS